MALKKQFESIKNEKHHIFFKQDFGGVSSTLVQFLAAF